MNTTKNFIIDSQYNISAGLVLAGYAEKTIYIGDTISANGSIYTVHQFLQPPGSPTGLITILVSR